MCATKRSKLEQRTREEVTATVTIQGGTAAQLPLFGEGDELEVVLVSLAQELGAGTDTPSFDNAL